MIGSHHLYLWLMPKTGDGHTELKVKSKGKVVPVLNQLITTP
jgi:hypothetical protein